MRGKATHKKIIIETITFLTSIIISVDVVVVVIAQLLLL